MKMRPDGAGVVVALAVAALVGAAGAAAGQTQTPGAFSNPTRIRNPYLPVSAIRQSIALGQADGESLRVEVTLLPGAHPGGDQTYGDQDQ